MNMSGCFILMILATPSVVALASENVSVQCPATIEVQEQAGAVPEGWVSFEPENRHPLRSVEFSEGVPTNRATLLPTEEPERSVSVWRFIPSEEDYWVLCSYNSTSIVMSRKLPRNTTACQVDYDGDFAVPLPKRIFCTVSGAEGRVTPRKRR